MRCPWLIQTYRFRFLYAVKLFSLLEKSAWAVMLKEILDINPFNRDFMSSFSLFEKQNQDDGVKI